MFENIPWEKLNHLQVGRFAEYLVKMSFSMEGFEVYTPEVDDHGVDMIARRKGGLFYDVQVKSIRGFQYIFFPEEKFKLRKELLAVVVLFPKNGEIKSHEPELFLIPSEDWKSTNGLLCYHGYKEAGQKSKPEYGLNISAKNKQLLDGYSFRSKIALI